LRRTGTGTTVGAAAASSTLKITDKMGTLVTDTEVVVVVEVAVLVSVTNTLVLKVDSLVRVAVTEEVSVLVGLMTVKVGTSVVVTTLDVNIVGTSVVNVLQDSVGTA
jgi:hypothetical protein